MNEIKRNTVAATEALTVAAAAVLQHSTTVTQPQTPTHSTLTLLVIIARPVIYRLYNSTGYI